MTYLCCECLKGNHKGCCNPKCECDFCKDERLKKMWWKGKQISFEEWKKKIEKPNRKNLLMCHKCCKPYKQTGKYEWKPDCNCLKKDIVLGVG